MQPIRDLPMPFSAHFQLLNSEKLVGITGFIPSRSLESLVYVEKCIIYFHLIWSHCAGKPFIELLCERKFYVFRMAMCIYKKGNCAYAIDLCIVNMYVISKFNWAIQLSVQLERIL